MVDQIVNYILQERQRNFPDNSIRKALTDAGYNDNEIDQGFQQVDNIIPKRNVLTNFISDKRHLYAVLAVILLMLAVFILVLTQGNKQVDAKKEDLESIEPEQTQEPEIQNQSEELTRKMNQELLEKEVEKCYEKHKELPFLAYINDNEELCDKEKNKTEKNYCNAFFYTTKAIMQKDSSFCRKISTDSRKQLCRAILSKDISCLNLDKVNRIYCKAMKSFNVSDCQAFMAMDDKENFKTCSGLVQLFSSIKSNCEDLSDNEAKNYCLSIINKDIGKYKAAMKETCRKSIAS